MIKLVIFDFDGVIVDSVKFNVEFANKMLVKFGKRRLSSKNERDAYTLTAKQFIAKHLPGVSFVRAYAYRYSIFLRSLNRFRKMRHLLKLLKWLKRDGKKMAIATNRADETFGLLDRLRISKYFDYVLTATTVKKPKPDPWVINFIVKRFKVKKKEVVYIGDTYVDAIAAKKAGVVSIIYNNKKCGDYHIKDLLEVKKVFRGL